jgi:hypothetical protein
MGMLRPRGLRSCSRLAIGGVDLALAQQGECDRADILGYRARA